MVRLSQTDLRGYLGEQLVDLLIEWLPDGDVLLTKQKMISMINSSYGTSILKNRQFRKNLLQSMNESDILKIHSQSKVFCDSYKQAVLPDRRKSGRSHPSSMDGFSASPPVGISLPPGQPECRTDG